MELPEVNSERWLSTELLEGEMWRRIKGFENLYTISNYGRVFSFRKRVGHTNKEQPPMIIKLFKNVHGYYYVNLHNNGTCKTKTIHRLVAEAFIPNPKNYSDVNHIDETHTNNNVDNLMWCTHKYNQNYGTIKERMKRKMTNHPVFSKEIAQYDLDGNFIKTFPSVREIKRELKLKGFKSIYDACFEINNTHTSHGFQWRYVQDGLDYTRNIGKVKRKHSTEKKRVYQYSLKMKFIASYESASEAARHVAVSSTNITACCKGKYETSGGYKWFYEPQHKQE